MRRVLTRCGLLGGLPLLLTGAAATPPTPVTLDPVGAGRVAAGLSDWQTMAFFLMFLLLAGLVERVVVAWRIAKANERLADAISKMAEADRLEATDIKVQLSLVQEALARWERTR